MDLYFCPAGKPSLHFSDSKDGKVLRTAGAENCTCAIPKQARKNHALTFRLDLSENDSVGDRKYVFAVDTEEELEHWMTALKTYGLSIQPDSLEAEPEPEDVAIEQPDEAGKFAAKLQGTNVKVLPGAKGLQVFDAGTGKMMLDHIYPYTSLKSCEESGDGFEIKLLDGKMVAFVLAGKGSLAAEKISDAIAGKLDASPAKKAPTEAEEALKAALQAQVEEMRTASKVVEPEPEPLAEPAPEPVEDAGEPAVKNPMDIGSSDGSSDEEAAPEPEPEPVPEPVPVPEPAPQVDEAAVKAAEEAVAAKAAEEAAAAAKAARPPPTRDDDGGTTFAVGLGAAEASLRVAATGFSILAQLPGAEAQLYPFELLRRWVHIEGEGVVLTPLTGEEVRLETAEGRAICEAAEEIVAVKVRSLAQMIFRGLFLVCALV